MRKNNTVAELKLPADKQSILRAYLAGDSDVLISLEQHVALADVQSVISKYEEDEAYFREECARIDAEAGLMARKDGNIAQTDAQRVIQLYRETELSTSEIAARLKLRVTYVKDVIAQYDAQ